jgi:hypothetical protein
LALIACLIAGGLGLLWGASAAQSQIQENAALKERVDELTVMNTGLRGRLTDSELIIDTQKYTAVALRDELTQLHKDKAGLETELGFVIKATLIHVSERRRVVSGTVKIAVEGTQGGSPVTLSAGALEGSPEKLTFRFRYFQEIEQTVVLPQDFAATAIKLEMIGNNSAPVEAQFVWAAE